ncbi:MAG: thiamine phosphate synthase [Desulfatibacillaceae bacterium]|nr:thiamine phosphate synthase [Desulfatibacillaceae bacterium]
MDENLFPQDFGLYLILTNPVAGYEKCTEQAVRLGVRLVQLRMKKAPVDAVLEKARILKGITEGSKTLFIVNDCVGTAMQANADGVHLGQEDMPLDQARRLWPEKGRIFGLSTHNSLQEAQARQACPHYIGVGPVFATPTKDVPDPTLGLEQMGRIIAASPLVCVAIGGIDHTNLGQVLAHGAKNFAVVRAVNQSANPGQAIARLMDIRQEHRAKAL